MNDIEKAKKLYKNGGYTCVLCKDETVFTSTLSGILPMVNFIDNDTDLNGFSVADKVVGKAAAMLFVLAGIKSVYADVISKTAVKILVKNNIAYSYEELTDAIINHSGTGLCPMEQAVSGISDTSEAFAAITSTIKNLKNKNTEDRK